jgi:hypothetical protein
VDLRGFIRRFDMPTGFTAPALLAFDDIRAYAITRDHLRDDVAGINASIELIRRTRGGSWPSGPVTEEYNYVDLVWHECEFRDGESFTYALYDAAGTYLGCCYLYPMGRRRSLTEELLAYDVDVSWWVTPQAYERDLYATAHRALLHWLDTEFPFTAPFWSNIEIPQHGS